MRADVVVVGAGPAGATVAQQLAASCAVVLVERAAPSVRRIGESLPPAARRALDDMGLSEQFLATGAAPCHANRSAWESEAPHEVDFLRDPDGCAWHVDRTTFDAMLRDAAGDAGAQLVTPASFVSATRAGDRWSVTLSDDRTSAAIEVDCAAIVDAGGRAAPIARAVGARRARRDRLVAAWVRGSSTTPSAPGISYVEAVAGGWWYTAPVPGRRREVVFHTDADLPSAAIARVRAADLVSLVAAGSGLADLLRADGFRPDGAHGFVAAHSATLSPVAGPGWLAAGDAAVSFDPIASQGLLNAIVTGLSGARAVAHYLSGAPGWCTSYEAMFSDVTLAYQRRWRATYAAARRFASSEFWERRVRSAETPPL